MFISHTPTYLGDDARWDAMQRRDRQADSAFVYAVKTTGVYCRPSCSARPHRRNVLFFDTTQGAVEAGFRPCKRCRPDRERETIAWDVQPSGFGQLLVAASSAGVAAVLMGDDAAVLTADLAARFPAAHLKRGPAGLAPAIAAVRRRLDDPRAAVDLPLDPRGGELARLVWDALRGIPVGTTASYGDVARAIGRPTAARAVAAACAANPLAVLIPCHRVVRAGGALSGYRWGVGRKQALLAREAAA